MFVCLLSQITISHIREKNQIDTLTNHTHYTQTPKKIIYIKDFIEMIWMTLFVFPFISLSFGHSFDFSVTDTKLEFQLNWPYIILLPMEFINKPKDSNINSIQWNQLLKHNFSQWFCARELFFFWNYFHSAMTNLTFKINIYAIYMKGEEKYTENSLC